MRGERRRTKVVLFFSLGVAVAFVSALGIVKLVGQVASTSHSQTHRHEGKRKRSDPW